MRVNGRERRLTFCEPDVEAHDSVYVETLEDGGREPSGRFCTYACLSAWIDTEDETEGTSYRYEPS